MKKRSLTKCLAERLRNRRIFAVRYRVNTAVYRGKKAETPERVTVNKGMHKIDPVAIIAALAACKLFWKLLVFVIKRKKRKKKQF